MEGVVERDDGGAAGRLPRDLHRVLDGLDARVGEHRLGRSLDRGDRVQAFGELDVRLVRGHVEAGVRVEVGLPLHRRDHLGGRVPDVQHRDPGREVDQPVAVDVLDDRARRAGGDHRVEVRDTGWHGVVPPSEPLGALGSGDLGDELAFLWDVHRTSVTPEARPRRRTGVPTHGRSFVPDVEIRGGRQRRWPRPMHRSVQSKHGLDRARHRLHPGDAPEAPGGGGGVDAPRPVGAQLRARGPDRLAQGRRADPHDRDGRGRHRGQAARDTSGG